MINISNPDIFKNIKKGDHKAFKELFEGYYTSLCFFAARYLNDIDTARDLVQNFYVDLWLNRENIETISTVKSYLFKSVKNRCIDFLRKKKTTVKFSEAELSIKPIPFQNLIEEAELNEHINASINELPDKCREIFVLCRFEGMKYAEIANHLNISIKTVEMQMGIALKRLRNNLSNYNMINLIIFVASKK